MARTVEQRWNGCKAGNVRFHKERSIAHRQLRFVTFENTSGEQRHMVCHVVEESEGSWKFSGGAGGGGWGAGSLQRGYAQANLGGGGWEQARQSYAGGSVEAGGKGAVRVE